MGITQQHVAMMLEVYLGLIRSEAASIAREMSRGEVAAVLNARRHASSPEEIAGELVPIIVRSELRQTDEHDAEAVCTVIDRGAARLAAARRHLETRSMCCASPSTASSTSSAGETTSKTS